MKHFTLLLSTIFVVSMSFTTFAQNFFQDFTPSEVEVLNQPIKAKNAHYFQVNLSAMQNSIASAGYREEVSLAASTFLIQLPNMKGGFSTFKVLRNQTMHPLLNAKYPNILSFDGVNKDNVLEKVKFDITPQGFHAMIYSPDHSTIFIDPIHASKPGKVMVYYKKDFSTNKVMACEFLSEDQNLKEILENGTPEYGSCEMRTYELALAATGEYTAFQGGATNAAAAQVTTVNRVNGVYERDIAVTMVLVPNNNLLIYTSTTSDPYTNGSAGTMITENVTNCNAVIGSSNYDIGHVFGTNSGGLAGLGVVCNTNNKARGVTGSSSPVNDPFDIDYVAHEMGHQFNMNHTQNNNCNRNGATAVEPGSASTIMGYAGICSPNVQNNSDDHFHGISLSEMTTLITASNHTCPVTTSLSNSAPVITSSNAAVYVPASTPFALTCVATDADNDPLTYNWEQTDNQVSTQPPVATSTTGPNFRSFSSSSSPTRYFPNLSAIAGGGPFTWEVVPSVTRSMDFRCSVRDNSAGPGGCQDFIDVTVNSVATAGPFVVSYPSATGITWTGNGAETVTWSVANTTAAPINAALVDIYLSTDGGLTFPTLLLAGTANDGSEGIVVPNITTSTARIMVINSGGTFFDISDNNFQITLGTPCNLPTQPVLSGVSNICSGETTTLSLVGSLNDAIQWQWYAGACNGNPVGTGTSINVSPSTTATYFARGTGGCVTSSLCGQFTVNVTAINTTVTQAGSNLTAVETGAAYQWLSCTNSMAPISGETSATYSPSLIVGSYAVEITKSGCVDTSLCIIINQAGLGEMNIYNVSMAPNPTDGLVTITWDEQAIIEDISILDVNGKVVLNDQSFMDNLTQINMTHLESAVYFVKIRHQAGIETLRLVKRQ